MAGKMPRVMWLLNHGAARRFEIPMLKACGFNEIFLPKNYPADPSFRSASVDFSEDQHLTIPSRDLAILNEADWYGDPGREVWSIANRHFSLIFFIVQSRETLEGVSRHFKGTAVWRAYGLDRTLTYSKVRKHFTGGLRNLENMGDRFWFGEAYKDLSEVEEEFIRKRAVYLPLGLPSLKIDDQWNGGDKRVFFVCPDLGFNPYYRKIYEDFKRDFSGLPYVIGGSQPIAVKDPNVLGFVSNEVHERNMRDLRAMFYHSREPRHVHFHPFEAVRAGMPLIFMADGMLDKLGGEDLPGRARSVAEARAKLLKLLQGDTRLADEIRQSQTKLLDAMKTDRLEQVWRDNLSQLVGQLQVGKTRPNNASPRKRRIAVIIPVGYRGGTLRAAKLLAMAISLGGVQAGEPAEVVLVHLDDPSVYSSHDWADLPTSIDIRSFRWRAIEAAEALRTMRYAGHSEWEPEFAKYLVMEDGIQELGDCDLWVVVSDRLSLPLLPLRPKILMIFDYLQRHYRITDLEEQILVTNRGADHILVTTEFARQDALQYAGVEASRITKVPMLAPERGNAARIQGIEKSHFLWTTNLGEHKNHMRALAALQLYYEIYGGRLECHVTGVGTDRILKSQLPHLQGLARTIAGSRVLKQMVKFVGELSEASYRQKLSTAAFLWHPAELDNGTFSVIEAAHYGVPSLSSDYPAMREIEEQFKLGLNFMDQGDPDHMAAQLHAMEINLVERERAVVAAEQLASQSIDCLAPEYWKVVREFI
ncbi:glycosyltransferase family 4 protein [Mesorhizobium huakuii]|uniref:Glycosyltransferase family 4 protein n=2 Tax=Mesorhizobium huakuii TaxID=28104 RepID=A0A7G6T3X7_9HYPH|nr:glycosyltransferase family 4 protein [Mesorhizobium huakuii]